MAGKSHLVKSENLQNSCQLIKSCYNPCRDPEPTAPACPPTSTTPEPTPEPTDDDDDCSKRIICIDAINDCGIPYGG